MTPLCAASLYHRIFGLYHVEEKIKLNGNLEAGNKTTTTEREKENVNNHDEMTRIITNVNVDSWCGASKLSVKMIEDGMCTTSAQLLNDNNVRERNVSALKKTAERKKLQKTRKLSRAWGKSLTFLTWQISTTKKLLPSLSRSQRARSRSVTHMKTSRPGFKLKSLITSR